MSLNGFYIRNGPNPQHKPHGPFHYWEGDGMLHSLKLSKGKAIYCSRFVKTYKYTLEKEFGFPIFPSFISGIYGLADIGRWIIFLLRVLIGQIDVTKGFGLANTSVALFSHKNNSRLVALCESDLPYVIDLMPNGDIKTLGRWNFKRFDNGESSSRQKFSFQNMTAHPKVDVNTKEIFAFSWTISFPYITYFYIDENGFIRNQVPLFSIKKPTFIHDFAITERFVIFQETQLVVEPMNLVLARGMPVVCDPKKVPRIGFMEKYSTSDSNMKWVSVPGFNALHIINAWEEGEDEIVLVAPNIMNLENIFLRIEMVHFSLEKVNINIKTGKVSRSVLSKRSLELGTINTCYAGKKNRYVYSGVLSENGPKMSGLVKIDLEKGCEVSVRFYGKDCYGGEPLFVAKDENDEDDGFVVTLMHNEKSNESRFLVMDAESPNLDIVAAIKLPRPVPYGFHGLFVNEKSLSNFYSK